MHQSEQIESYLTANLPRYLDILRKMVDINSFTSNPAGVNALGELTSQVFKPMGFQAEQVQAADPRFGKHLLMNRPSPAGSGLTLALISHLDTVFPPEEEQLNNFFWRVESDRAYGPGTNDIKGGTVMIYMVLDAIFRFSPGVFNSINWFIALNACEEELSDDFDALVLDRLPEDATACLIFEAGALTSEGFKLVASRKGRATFNISVEGRSGHAGNNHEQGANAIVQIAQIIQQVATMTDYDKAITFNVGTVQGGTVVNRVAHLAQAGVEMRAFDPKIFETGFNQLMALADQQPLTSADGFPCTVIIESPDRVSPWPRNNNTDQLLQLWAEVAEQMDTAVIPEARGGLSDGNLLWQHIPTLDGLGPSGANAHCSERTSDGSKDQEYAVISSFVPKALLNTLSILELVKRRG